MVVFLLQKFIFSALAVSISNNTTLDKLTNRNELLLLTEKSFSLVIIDLEIMLTLCTLVILSQEPVKFCILF